MPPAASASGLSRLPESAEPCSMVLGATLVESEGAVAWWLALSPLSLPAPSIARADEPLVISAADLAKRLGEPDLVLLNVGDRAEYDRAHIPGAPRTR